MNFFGDSVHTDIWDLTVHVGPVNTNELGDIKCQQGI